MHEFHDWLILNWWLILHKIKDRLTGLENKSLLVYLFKTIGDLTYNHFLWETYLTHLIEDVFSWKHLSLIDYHLAGAIPFVTVCPSVTASIFFVILVRYRTSKKKDIFLLNKLTVAFYFIHSTIVITLSASRSFFAYFLLLDIWGTYILFASEEV